MAYTLNTQFRPDWYDYANANPIRPVDPTGLLVELYCEGMGTAQYGMGGLGAHFFLQTACEGCDQSYDRTLELFGPNRSLQYGRPMNQPFAPSFNGHGTTRRRGLSGPGMPGHCGTERCLLNSFASQPIPPYNGRGPNSNTFAAAMLGERGPVGDFPWNAVGSGY